MILLVVDKNLVVVSQILYVYRSLGRSKNNLEFEGCKKTERKDKCVWIPTTYLNYSKNEFDV